MTKQIPWNTGDGNITLTFNGQGNDSVIVDSDINNLNVARSQVLTFTGGGITRQVTVRQEAHPSPLPYDAEVEWLGTDGSCEVVTDYIPTASDIVIEGKYYFGGYSTSASWIRWFAANTDNPGSSYQIIRFYNLNTAIRIFDGNNDNSANFQLTNNVVVDTWYEFTITPTSLTWNNDTYTGTVNVGNPNVNPLKVFGTGFIGKSQGLRFSRNGAAEIDLIPVRKNGVGYFYDKVSGNLYGATSGTLTIGPDKID